MSGTPGRGAPPPPPQDAAEQQPPWRAAANVAAAEAAGFVWTRVRGYPDWPSQVVPAAEVDRLVVERQLPSRPAALADALVRCAGRSQPLRARWVPLATRAPRRAGQRGAKRPARRRAEASALNKSAERRPCALRARAQCADAHTPRSWFNFSGPQSFPGWRGVTRSRGRTA